jgi:hypothetical protein
MCGYYGYEVGPIRPPSEAKSLFIRVTRNCQWNRCTFCPVYKDSEFSARSVDAVISDIDIIHKHLSSIREVFSSSLNITSEGVWSLAQTVDPLELLAFDSALKWFRDGMQSVFLQDADALVVGSEGLIRILTHLHDTFPWLTRVTSYSRSSTILKIGDEGLRAIKNAGLDRLHVGLESGSDRVLRLVRKGASKEMHVKAGLMSKGAHLELSEYVMPGLGGMALSEEHAIETADALNLINPDFVRLRPLAFTSRAPLHLERDAGTFLPCNDIAIARELQLLIKHLNGITSMVVSDHILNLFADLEGRIPEEKQKMLSILQLFLDMDSEQQLLFRLGRRIGLFSGLNDMKDRVKLEQTRKLALKRGITAENIDSIISEILEQFI